MKKTFEQEIRYKILNDKIKRQIKEITEELNATQNLDVSDTDLLNKTAEIPQP